ncbi:hypothetical protein INT43_005048 [Umbelopsis isabellina]|uniref:EIPR1-like beta-propeller domain-containing protein n=1 Tax=Mortierella isabellina TaxID=91625 RepID=A0A8H7U8R1_MORIS|nr:hypothetical protein INT43_005048 [Umbelopsis isabellina]
MNDRDENSCVYGLRQQARCLTSVYNDSDSSEFLAGTAAPNGENYVHLLTFDDSTFTARPTLYHHPHEIWDIAACPFNQHYFVTTFTDNDGEKTSALWKKESVESVDQMLSPRPDSSSEDLTLLTTIPSKQIQKTMWASHGEQNRLATMSDSYIQIWELDSAHENASNRSTWKISSEDESKYIADMVWSPHSDEIVAAYGSTVAGWDVRSGKTTFEKHRAHPASIRAVDYNNNKPHHIVTGGDDATLCIWDTRNLSSPLMEIVKHTHWIWDVAYNSVHDQLILSSSSDTLVTLNSAVSVSSASYMGEEYDDDDESASSYEIKERPTDGFIKAYDQHEDSVYSVAWSHSDIWVFASLSYDGRVVINRVPTSEKFKILGI